MKQKCHFTNFFKSVINVIKREKKPVKKKTSKKTTKKKENKDSSKIKKTKNKNNSNMQMPAPWSKVEKYKKIKKDNF